MRVDPRILVLGFLVPLLTACGGGGGSSSSSTGSCRVEGEDIENGASFFAYTGAVSPVGPAGGFCAREEYVCRNGTVRDEVGRAVEADPLVRFDSRFACRADPMDVLEEFRNAEFDIVDDAYVIEATSEDDGTNLITGILFRVLPPEQLDGSSPTPARNDPNQVYSFIVYGSADMEVESKLGTLPAAPTGRFGQLDYALGFVDVVEVFTEPTALANYVSVLEDAEYKPVLQELGTTILRRETREGELRIPADQQTRFAFIHPQVGELQATCGFTINDGDGVNALGVTDDPIAGTNEFPLDTLVNELVTNPPSPSLTDGDQLRLACAVGIDPSVIGESFNGPVLDITYECGAGC